jgi:23S rRNA (uracil-5-)-methyltransferase RumA
MGLQNNFGCINGNLGKKSRKRGKRRKKEELRIELPDSEKIPPKCPHFGVCGCCSFQDIPCQKQIKFKKSLLKEILGMDIEVIPSPKIYGCKNRIDLTVSDEGIGYRPKGMWWKSIDIAECPVFGEKAKAAIVGARQMISQRKLSPWNLRKNEGFLRYIVLREGKFSGELMVSVVTTEGEFDCPNEYFSADSLYHLVCPISGDTSFGEKKNFWGQEHICETLNGINYLIGPNSFFQTNSHQAENLIKKVSEFVGEGSEKVLDMYCGLGTFGIFLAKKGYYVKGVDSNPEAVALANRNAVFNRVERRSEFFVGEDRAVEELDFDAVILDPPRAGLHPRLTKRLLRAMPKKIIYVSCNPKSLAEDLKKLSEGYLLKDKIAFDMFPHTPHIETVVSLEKRR